MIFQFLFYQSFSKPPVILIPGIFDSRLYLTYNRNDTSWYCPKKQNHTLFKMNSFATFCHYPLMTLEYDSVQQKSIFKENVTITSEDGDNFGSIDSLQNFEEIISQLESVGYVNKKNLFGVGYDYHYGLNQPNSFWISFENLIKTSFIQNTEEPASIICFSMGCRIFNEFFKWKNPSEKWKSKYIRNLVMISPSFSGSINFLERIWKEKKYFISLPKSFIHYYRSVNGFYVHLPNQELFSERNVIQSPDNILYPAKSIVPLIQQNNFLTSSENQIFKSNIKYMQYGPKNFGISTYLIANSAVSTPVGIKLQRTPSNLTQDNQDNQNNQKDYEINSWKIYSLIYGKGDGSMPDFGFEWLRKNLNLDGYYDLNLNDCDHGRMIKHPLIIQKALEFGLGLKIQINNTKDDSL